MKTTDDDFGPRLFSFAKKVAFYFSCPLRMMKTKGEKGAKTVRVCLVERPIELARYLLETKGTVRSVARKFCLSKSTAHKDLTTSLRSLDRSLFEEVRALLEENKRQRHLRGGQATKEKYNQMRKNSGN